MNPIHISSEPAFKIETGNFVATFSKTNRIGVYHPSIEYRGKPISIISIHEAELIVAEAASITIDELQEIPIYLRIINTSDFELGLENCPHDKTVIGYDKEETIVGIVAWEPKDKEFFGDEYPNEKYRICLKEEVKNDSRFELDSSDEDLNKEAIKGMKSRGFILECDAEPVAFTVNLKVETFGELSSAVDMILFELEEKVKLKY